LSKCTNAQHTKPGLSMLDGFLLSLLATCMLSYASSTGWAQDSTPQLIPMVHSALGIGRQFDLRYEKKNPTAYARLTMEQKKIVDNAENQMRKIAPEIIKMLADKAVIVSRNRCDAISEPDVQSKLKACENLINQNRKEIEILSKKIESSRAKLSTSVGQYNYFFDPAEMRNQVLPANVTEAEKSQNAEFEKQVLAKAELDSASKGCVCPSAVGPGTGAKPQTSPKTIK
jgi:GTPase involved in cell partitioning and DNA repair